MIKSTHYFPRDAMGILEVDSAVDQITLAMETLSARSDQRGKDYIHSPHKRFIDITAASCLAIPAAAGTLLGALLLTYESPSQPRTIRMKRHGEGKSSIVKLRTMVDGSHIQEAVIAKGRSLGQLAEAGDPRVTPMGRFIRSASHDELPSIFQVLHGSLSLVGPRMLTSYEYQTFIKPRITASPSYERYDALVVNDSSRKFGWTGPYAIAGRKELSWDRRVQLEGYYMESAACASVDLWIALQTPHKAFKYREGQK